MAELVLKNCEKLCLFQKTRLSCAFIINYYYFCMLRNKTTMKTRTILFTLALMLSALTMSAAVQSTDWRATVDRLMEQGEFKQAEKLMKSMPKKVRQQNAVTIDSLCQIMERIRKDFRITP